ncbi:MAG: RNA polymerase sporulation sigma factor SigK [Clostridia bacterium]|nr:RNA polymerase sporulation sigma factor SigK [Clostridia bacterium]MCI9084832.1 RNA polymerase sporulation sigma factor SigK [Clostridia bacterium]
MFGIFFEWIQTVLVLAGYVSGNATFPKPLSSAEEKKYLALYADGDEDAKNILIEHNLRLVAHIAKKYADEKTLEDLISIGTIGLIKGINTFNPTKNSKLSTYISRCIENEVLMFLRSSKKQQSEVSLDDSIGTDREGNNMTFSDILTSDTAEVSDIIFGKLEAQKLYMAMKKVLNKNEINILCWRYGLGNQKKKTQKEIADILGISRSYVSRIEKKCLEKLLAELKE